ncbi:hypothetical protein [Psychroserpens ponticola]|uniref:Uncharacterized protein n=1 Tax=Psychroserpens ponticola TaxID=2932268 RepID=A0ABY7RT21_9FLAO|nr:hypothetical protein [Psychroserpens ponticola]WCO00263.1 hypothetical protein MUN68_009270 [Psychroserpens ponticola]
MTQAEYSDDTKYYEIGEKKLKSEYLLHYHSRPNWTAIPRVIDIFIDKNYCFEVKLFWYKFPAKKRLFSFYQSNLLPENIIQIIEDFKSIEKVNLKTLYTSKKEKYSPEGISEDLYRFNHSSNSFSISMSSHWTDEKLFKSPEEILFLKLHKILDNWKDSLYEGIISLHK